MNLILLFFVLPLATIIFSIALEKLLDNPFLVSAIIFVVFLIVAFVALGINFIIAAIIYGIITIITTTITIITTTIIITIIIGSQILGLAESVIFKDVFVET